VNITQQLFLLFVL